MTGISLAHKFNTFRKHTKKLKSLWISVKLHGKAGTRALECDIALPKNRGYLLLTTEPRTNRRSRQLTLGVKDDGQETRTRVLSAFSETGRALLGSLCP